MQLFVVTKRKSFVRKPREQQQREWEALQEELNDYSLYKRKIKNNCFICGVWYKNNWALYQVYGNCCPVCSGRVVSVLYCYKQRTKSPLTREESNLLLTARRRWILNNGLDLPPSERKEFLKNNRPPLSEESESEKTINGRML